MSIPYWRYFDYTDDGCSLYECLNCYNQWEARTNPEYAEWKFCPYCGCRWEGEKKWDEKTKWNRKKGRNPEPTDRLALPLFVVEKKAVPFEKDENTHENWEEVSYQSEDIMSAIHTASFDSQREAEMEPFWCYYVYRIVYRPYKLKYGKDKAKNLRWAREEKSKCIQRNWNQYKHNVKKITAFIPSKFS